LVLDFAAQLLVLSPGHEVTQNLLGEGRQPSEV